jgi:hypothetical protein
MGFFIFFLALSIYSYSAVPIIFFEDNPEFITTAYTLGISHPSGYPLTNILGNLAGLLPFGNFAYKCNLLSSFFGAVAVYFFHKCNVVLTKDRILSVIATLIFMMSGNLWSQATIMEVYTLNYAFFFGIFWIALSGRLIDFRWLLLSSFLFGLGVTNHLSAALALVPFTLLWLAKRNDWLYKMNLANFAFLLLAGGLSWFIQLYLPARSISGAENILFSWGKITSLDSFFTNITGAIYFDMPFNQGSMLQRVNMLVNYLMEVEIWIWIIMTFFFIYGFFRMLGANLSGTAAFMSGIAVYVAYAILHYSAIDIMLVIPTGLALMVIVFGAKKLDFISRNASLVMFGAITVFIAVSNSTKYDQHSDFSAYDYAVDIFENIPPGGKLQLSPGHELNYLLFYSIFGPGGIPDTSLAKNRKPFYPYIPMDEKTKTNYLLYYTEPPWPEENRDPAAWDYVRSMSIDNSHLNFKGGVLTRDAFKGKVLSRLAISKGHYFFEEGDVEKSRFYYNLGAKWHQEGVTREAAIRHSWGDTDRAITLIEAIMRVKPSTNASTLLAKLKMQRKAEEMAEEKAAQEAGETEEGDDNK